MKPDAKKVICLKVKEVNFVPEKVSGMTMMKKPNQDGKNFYDEWLRGTATS